MDIYRLAITTNIGAPLQQETQGFLFHKILKVKINEKAVKKIQERQVLNHKNVYP